MSEFETVKYEAVEDVATITLNRPDTRNSFNQQLRIELGLAVTRASKDDAVRVVIIRGEGKGFSAGADLSEEIPDYDGYVTYQLQAEYMPTLAAITSSSKPFIAEVNGAAAGIGSALVMICDLAVMAEDAFLYSAFAAISLVPDGGFHWLLSQRIGHKKAYEVILESQRITAQQCLEQGLCNKVVPADSLTSVTREWAQKLAKTAPLTAAYSKQILARAASQSLLESMTLESELQNTCIRSDDFKEGVDAFFSKREPSFKGK